MKPINFPPADWHWNPEYNYIFPCDLKRPWNLINCAFDPFANTDFAYANTFHALAFLNPTQRFVWATKNPETARYFYGDPERPAWIVKEAVRIAKEHGRYTEESIRQVSEGIDIAGMSDVVRRRGYYLENVFGAYHFSGRISEHLTRKLETFATLPVARRFYWFGSDASLFRFGKFVHRERWETVGNCENASQTDVVDLVQTSVRSIDWVVCDATDKPRTQAVFNECILSGTPIWFSQARALPRDMQLQQYPSDWNKEPAI